MNVFYRRFLYCLLILNTTLIDAQTSFPCSGQAYLINEDDDGERELVNLGINPSNSGIEFKTITKLPKDADALSFRSTDNLLYGIANQSLFQIDALGNYTIITSLSEDENINYTAGDISPDGRYMTVIAAVNGFNKELITIDLVNNYTTESFLVNSTMQFVDIAYDPFDNNTVYAYDLIGRNILKINIQTRQILLFQEISTEQEIQALFFNAFGTLMAYGTTAYGVSGAIFSIDKTTGIIARRNTGPANVTFDAAACPYTVELFQDVSPRIAFPCEEVVYQLKIANTTGNVLRNIDVEVAMPPSFSYEKLVYNPYLGRVEATNEGIRLKNMTLKKGIDSIGILVTLGDVQAGVYASQSDMSLPIEYGGNRLSDFPATFATYDATNVKINRTEEDSLFLTRFFCLGETLVLDGSEYGNTMDWSTTEATPEITISEEGIYTVQASSGCQSVFITYDVVTASCPFTIELRHEIFPSETLPCSELIYQFAFENDAGVTQNGISFHYDLPLGFNFVEILSNSMGGVVEWDAENYEITIHNMTLPNGIDTLTMLVEVGDLAPGIYNHQAYIDGLPEKIGAKRFSDDPNTLLNDSTTLVLLGVEKDSLFLQVPLCNGSSVVLDGRSYGTAHSWDNGATTPSITVDKIGVYELIVYDGCTPSYIFFEVIEGEAIQIKPYITSMLLNLGDSILLDPLITNEGDSLVVKWIDLTADTLMCTNCTTQYVQPLQNTTYQIKANNEVCSDSTQLVIKVDNTRRIYVPTAFSPNNDGVNDYFYIQTPDFAKLESFTVFDRWGNQVFQQKSQLVNESKDGWNGLYSGAVTSKGVYIWQAKITFLDGLTEVFTGEVLVQ